jgi:hypothetical protein
MLNKDLDYEKKYIIDNIKVKINIGSSNDNTKRIYLGYCPDNIRYDIQLHNNPTSNKFKFKITNNSIIIKRADKNEGWSHDHNIDLLFNEKCSIYLFREHLPNKNLISTAYVSHKNKKILDCRDPEYLNNDGW